MKIKPNASPDELSSPFYKANEAFCHAFENYISTKNGMVKGRYNAWSYLIFGKLESPKKWNLMYKKSTYSSSGNLLLSSKSQSLLTLVTWTTKLSNNKHTDFIIRRRKSLDFVRVLFNKRLNKLNIAHNYVLKSKASLPEPIYSILIALKSLFENKNIYTIDLKNNVLTIELRSEKHHFDLFDTIIHLAE